MSKVMHLGCPPSEGTRAFLATPAYGGVTPAYAYALFASQRALMEAGIAAELEIFAGNCHVDDSRNQLVRDFLETDCTDLVFLDCDMRWNASDLVKLLRYDRDVVAATYPLKQADEGYPVRHIAGPLQADADGLLEVEAVPTGFLRIRRHVLEAMAKDAPKFPAKSDVKRTPIPLIFERRLEDGARWGGDYVFCRRWRAMGGKIFLDPEMRFEHYGESVWQGTYGEYLRRNNGLSLGHCLQAIRDGKEDERIFTELIQTWGNSQWSAGQELLAALCAVARETNGPILETGSGLSTLVMAAANPNVQIVALEHDPIWASHTRGMLEQHELKAEIIHCPLKDFGEFAWYDYESETQFAMLLCDGPPRATKGGRAGVHRLAHNVQKGAIVIMDDVSEPVWFAGASLVPVAQHRTFVIGRV